MGLQTAWGNFVVAEKKPEHILHSQESETAAQGTRNDEILVNPTDGKTKKREPSSVCRTNCSLETSSSIVRSSAQTVKSMMLL